MEKNSIKKLYKKYNEGLTEFLSIPSINETVTVFMFAVIATATTILLNSQFEISGFMLFGVTIIFSVWSIINIHYIKKREKNKPKV